MTCPLCSYTVRGARVRNFLSSLVKWRSNDDNGKMLINSTFCSHLLADIICGPMYSGATPCPIRAPLVVVIVGQPCRGKSLAAHKVVRQLNWKGEAAKGRSWCYFAIIRCSCCHFFVHLNRSSQNMYIYLLIKWDNDGF